MNSQYEQLPRSNVQWVLAYSLKHPVAYFVEPRLPDRGICDQLSRLKGTMQIIDFAAAGGESDRTGKDKPLCSVDTVPDPTGRIRFDGEQQYRCDVSKAGCRQQQDQKNAQAPTGGLVRQESKLPHRARSSSQIA